MCNSGKCYYENEKGDCTLKGDEIPDDAGCYEDEEIEEEEE